MISPRTDHHGPSEYAIHVHGSLGPTWSAWFDGLALSTPGDGTTTIHGAALDQAALHGLLTTLRDLGLPILSVTRVTPPAGSTGPVPGDHPDPAPAKDR